MTVKLSEAKIVTQLLYGVPLRAVLVDEHLDTISQILRKLLPAPYCVSQVWNLLLGGKSVGSSFQLPIKIPLGLSYGQSSQPAIKEFICQSLVWAHRCQTSEVGDG